MSGPLSKYPSQGDPLSGFPASWFPWADQLLRRVEKQLATTGQGKVVVPSDVVLSIQNITGGSLAQYAIVGIGANLVTPTAADQAFFGETVFESASPSDTAPFAILQEPGLDDDILKARVSGISFCKMDVSDITHDYANAVAADYDKLTSQSGVGPATILWMDTQASTQLNGAINDSVTEIVVDDGGNFPQVPFVVTIGTEDLNVTQTHAETTLDEPSDITASQTSIVVASSAGVPATPFDARIEDEYITVTNVVSVTWTITRAPGAVAHEDGAEVVVLDYTTWQVTRGHNSTTPASHADNAAVTFKTGVVWALVMLTGTSASGGGSGITSINSDSTAAQVFSVGTSGTDFAITDTGAGTLRWDLPSASATARGVVTTTTQTFGGDKTFNGIVTKAGSGSAFIHEYDANTTVYYGSLSVNGPAIVDIVLSDDGYGNLAEGRADVYPPLLSDDDPLTYDRHTLLVLSGLNITPTPDTLEDTEPSFAVNNGSLLVGIWATVVLAKITAGGTNGSLTVSGGIITAYTAPT